MSCGATEFASGGVINQSTITNSHILNSTIQASSFESGTIRNLAEIDNASVRAIADAIAKLDAASLKALADAISGAMLQPGAQPAPPTAEHAALPVKRYGEVTALLGEPKQWVSYSGGTVPVY